jgi:lambda family phage tail tape measure protein
MAVGELIVQLMAETGSFETDTKRAGDTIAKLEKLVKQLNKTMGEGYQSSNNFVGPLQPGKLRPAIEGVERLNSAVQKSHGAFRASNQVMQQASYQITDFVVQVSGGVSAMRAFSQQAPQLLGAFGAGGAVLGLFAALGGAVGDLVMKMSGAKTIADSLRDLDDALGKVTSTAQTFDMKNMIEQFNAADANVRRGIISLIEYRRVAAEIAAEETAKTLQSELKDVVSPGFLKRTIGDFSGADLGIDKKIAQDFFAEIRSGNTEASILAQKYSTELIKGNSKAQELAATINKVAMAQQSAANAASATSKFLQQASTAGATGKIPVTTTNAVGDNFLNALEARTKKVEAGEIAMLRMQAAQRGVLMQAEPLLDLLTKQEWNKQAVKFNETLELSTVSLQNQTSLVGKSAQEVAVLNNAYRIRAELDKQLIDLRLRLGAVDMAVEAQMRADAEATIAAQSAIITATQERQRTATFGMESAIRNYTDSAGNMARGMEQAFNNAFKGMEDGIVQFAMTGKFAFADFANSVIADIMRIYVRQALIGMIGQAVGAFAGAGAGMSSATQSASYGGAGQQFSNTGGNISSWGSMKFAEGGYTGDGGKYQPAGVVHAGEFVMNKEATSRIGVGALYRMMRGYADGGYVGGSMPTMSGGGGGVNINIKNEAGADGYTATATARKNETGFNIDVLVRKALTDDMRNNGPMSQTISATYGLRRSA